MSSITDIKEHLEVLNLNSTRMPTMKEYKKAYRELMKLHPDLGGETTRFQEITLAARMIFEFITKHQGEQTRTDSDDADLLKAFEASNNVNYNSVNIVFNIDPVASSLWVECVTKRKTSSAGKRECPPAPPHACALPVRMRAVMLIYVAWIEI